MQEQVVDVPPIQSLDTQNFEQPISENKPALRSKSAALIFGLVFLIVIGVSAVQFFVNKFPTTDQQNIVSDPQPISDTPTTAINPLPNSFLTAPDPKRRVIYLYEPDSTKENNWEAAFHPADQPISQLKIPSLRTMEKHPESNVVFYTTYADESSFSVMNLDTNETRSFTPIVHPNPAVKPHLQIFSGAISPDNSIVIFNVPIFSEPCETALEPEEGGRGSGPCTPDEIPELPTGYYAYFLETQEKYYLGETITVAKWDMNNKSVYFNSLAWNDGGLKRFDFTTKQISVVEKAQNFSYASFLLSEPNNYITVTGDTGDTQDKPSFSQISYRPAGKPEQVVQRGKWAQIQPFVSVSPDEKYALYLTSELTADHQSVQSWNKFDLQTGIVTALTPQNQDSYGAHIAWLDSRTVFMIVRKITSVTQPPQPSVSYFVTINVETGEITRVSEESRYQFGN